MVRIKKEDASKFDIDNIRVFKLRQQTDNRGSFTAVYEEENPTTTKTINISTTNLGFLRGLHYQYDKPISKYIAVIDGSIWDCIINIIEGHKDYGKCIMTLLKQGQAINIPYGYAHGFTPETPLATILYKYDNIYNPHGEGVINPLDEDLEINWRNIWVEENPRKFLSVRDYNAETFKEYKKHPKFKIED